MYAAEVELGTPPQKFRLLLDTGSSDLWVHTPESPHCQQPKHKENCAESGAYNSSASSTYSYLGNHFNITYVDGTCASGDYARDTMSISGITLKNFQFGVAHEVSSSDGILGIGYPNNEVQVGRAKMTPYANLPQRLADEGIISSPAYSLWLNGLNSASGNILFGGIDTERFEGNLSTLPVQRKDGEYTDLLITLTGVSFDGKPVAENKKQAALLDSGSTLIYLPNYITSQLAQSVGGVYEPGQNAYFCPCSLADSSKTLDLTFSGVTIRIPASELVLSLENTAGEKVYKEETGEQMCLFGVAPSGTKTPVLGDTFLRSAYVVYDLANNEISLAQTKWNVTKSNIVEIGSGEDAVPSKTRVVEPVAATAGVGQVFRNTAWKSRELKVWVLLAPIVGTLWLASI